MPHNNISIHKVSKIIIKKPILLEKSDCHALRIDIYQENEGHIEITLFSYDKDTLKIKSK